MKTQHWALESGGLITQRVQQPFKVFPARAASAQVRGDAGIELLHQIAGGCQLGGAPTATDHRSGVRLAMREFLPAGRQQERTGAAD